MNGLEFKRGNVTWYQFGGAMCQTNIMVEREEGGLVNFDFMSDG